MVFEPSFQGWFSWATWNRLLHFSPLSDQCEREFCGLELVKWNPEIMRKVFSSLGMNLVRISGIGKHQILSPRHSQRTLQVTCVTEDTISQELVLRKCVCMVVGWLTFLTYWFHFHCGQTLWRASLACTCVHSTLECSLWESICWVVYHFVLQPLCRLWNGHLAFLFVWEKQLLPSYCYGCHAAVGNSGKPYDFLPSSHTLFGNWTGIWRSEIYSFIFALTCTWDILFFR